MAVTRREGSELKRLERDEPDTQRDADRELDELLGELRVVLPGVTVLFAFLLTLPFTGKFPDVDSLDRAAYFVAFIASAVSMVFLVGESAYHRLVGKPYDKGVLIHTVGRQAVMGIGCLALALTAVVFLVTDVVYGATLAAFVTAAVLALALVVWFAFPLSRRRSRQG